MKAEQEGFSYNKPTEVYFGGKKVKLRLGTYAHIYHLSRRDGCK